MGKDRGSNSGPAEGSREVGAEWMSRRSFLKMSGVGVAGVTLLGVAGCGGDGGGEEQGGGQNGGGGGNSITVGYDQEPQILNPIITGGDLAATGDTTAGITQSPIRPMPDLTYAPELADGEPQTSENPFTVQYTLKEGLTWSDGEPLTSEDARWTYDQIMDENNQIITREGWDKIESFETPDERTVRMVFSEPYAPWRVLVSEVIFPKHIYEGEDFNEALNNQIVGSGPFVLEEWNKGQSLTLARNENYWGDPPALERITFRFITDTNSVIAALQAGEVDFINPPPDIGLLERLRGIQGTNTDTAPGTIWEHIAFNTDVIDNVNLRQAIAYGINREQVLTEILPGQVSELNSVLVPEQDLYYTPAWEQYGYDPERARQLVEQAQSEGAETTIEFSTTSGNALRETLQQAVQQQLSDIGLTVNINNYAAQDFFGNVTPEGDFQMGEWAWLSTPDPQLTLLFGGNAIPPDGQNYYRYDNQEVTQLLEQSDVTVDDSERADLLKQAQDLMAEDVPLIPMFQRPVYYSYTENLQGPEVNPTIAGPYWNVGEWSLQSG